MDQIYRFQRHLYDITRKYYLLGRDKLIEDLNAAPGCEVLEIGCGTGRNLVTAAHRWPSAQFTGLDISQAMLETAAVSVRRSALGHRISLIEADACAFAATLPLRGKKFDRIFMSYTLSMIPAWERAIEEALTVLAPDGTLHIIDFGQLERLPRFLRAGLFAWLAHFHVSPRAELRTTLEDVAFRHKRQCRFQALHRGYAWHYTLA